MATSTLNSKIAEIIENLGDDEDVIQTVKDKLGWKEIIEEASSTKEVRDALNSLVVKVIESLEEDSDASNTIQETLDLPELIKKAMAEDESLRIMLGKKIKKAIITAVDEDSLDNQITNLLESDDFNIQTLVQNNNEIKEIIAEQILKYVKEIDLDEHDVLKEKIDENVLSEEEVGKVVQANQKELFKILEERILEFITKGLSEDESVLQERVLNVIENSEMLDKAVQGALKNLISNENFQDTVEKLLEKAFKKDNSSLQSKISQAISEKLVDRMAVAAVEKLFSGDKRY